MKHLLTLALVACLSVIIASCEKPVTGVKDPSSSTSQAIVSKNVNVRSGPGTSYPKVGSPLISGTRVSVLTERDGWTEIGAERWVASNFLR